MLPTFSPQSLDLGKVFVNTTDPGVDLDLNDPLPFPSDFPGTIHSDPAPQNTTISVAIESPSGTFQIRDSILFDVGMVRIFDPDVGHFVRIKAYTVAGWHAGPGSIAVEAGQVLVVRVAFKAGPEPGTQTGQVSITDSDSGAATIPVSLQTIARGGMVETSVAADHFSIRAASAAELPVTVTWKSGPAADVTFRKSDILLDAKVSMQETTVHVEPGETRNATLLFRADPDAKLGTFDLAIQQFGPNRLPFLDLRVTITPAPGGGTGTAGDLARTAIKQKATDPEIAPRLGTPTGDVQPITSPGAVEAFAQRFQFGTVYFSLFTGAHEVNGEINAHYDDLGGPLASQIGLQNLGLPITDEKVALDGKGRISDFENGSIYWHPRTGPILNHDIIKAAYGPTGFEVGPLGYPTLDTHSWKRADAQARLVWGLFENGCIAANFKAPAVVVAGSDNTAEIDRDTLEKMVRHAIDKKIHEKDINVGLHPGIAIAGVSDWQHGFGASGRRIITFRLRGFKDMGKILPDVDFTFDVPLQFGWADDPMSIIDPGSRTLGARVGNIAVFDVSATSIPVLELVNVLADALVPSPPQITDTFQLDPIPVEKKFNGDPVRIIMEMLVTPEGGMRFFCNPFSPLGGVFGPEVQLQISDQVTKFLDS